MLRENIFFLRQKNVNMHAEHYINELFCKITQLSSVESYCVDCLSGPEDSMKPPSCNSNNSPTFQSLRKHLDPHPI